MQLLKKNLEICSTSVLSSYFLYLKLIFFGTKSKISTQIIPLFISFDTYFLPQKKRETMFLELLRKILKVNLILVD